ncbi:hypothetical protein TNCV_4492191 [Trichonephila clavipes]|nr:hypothetical protein TNCV_4492191 [Trichonephila clavipes]
MSTSTYKTQERMLPVMSLPTSILRVFDCSFGQHVLPSSPTIEYIWSWVSEGLPPFPTLHLQRLIKCDIDLKRPRINCLYVSFKPSSIRCLTGFEMV